MMRSVPEASARRMKTLAVKSSLPATPGVSVAPSVRMSPLSGLLCGVVGRGLPMRARPVGLASEGGGGSFVLSGMGLIRHVSVRNVMIGPVAHVPGMVPPPTSVTSPVVKSSATPGGMMRISVAFPPKPVSLVAPAEPNLDAHTSWLIENAPVVSSNVTGISTPTASLNGSSFCGPGPPSATPGATSVIVHVPLVLAVAPEETAARSAAATRTLSFVMVFPPRTPGSGVLALVLPRELEHVALAREVAVLHEVGSADHEGDREIAVARVERREIEALAGEREPVAARAPVEHEREHAAGDGRAPAEMAVALHGKIGGDDLHRFAPRRGELHGDAC